MMRSFIIFFNLLAFSASEIIHYRDHIINPLQPEYLIIPKYDKNEVPDWSPGNGQSFIDLAELHVYSSCDATNHHIPPIPRKGGQECEDAVFQMLMFEAPLDKNWMKFWGNGHYCCTQSIYENGGCSKTQLDKLIVPSSLTSAYIRTTVVKPDETTSVSGQDEISHHQISNSGLYVLLMALCDSSAPPVVIDGTIDSIDPYGYVPADQYGNIPFYLWLSFAHLIIGLIWLGFCIYYRDQIIPLQMWISAVLAVAVFETSLLYAHYMNWNTYGEPTYALTVVALLFGAVKRAVSRVLVQLVALGYGVVRPSLGEDMNRVLYLGSAYFVLSFAYGLLVNLPNNTKNVEGPPVDAVSFVVFLLAVIDTTFYIWIFTSINNLLVSLASRKQGVKYLLYKNFRTVLFLLLFLTCMWALYSSALFINDSGGTNKHWREKWTIDALWEIIYFIIFIAIAILWAPSNNSQRYAYSVELTQLEDDSEWNAASAPGVETAGGDDGEIDDEYGGRLQDEKDPFQGTGALDPTMAATKKA